MLKFARIPVTDKTIYINTDAVCAVYANGPKETCIELGNNAEPMTLTVPEGVVMEALERTLNENMDCLVNGVVDKQVVGFSTLHGQARKD